MKRIDKLYTQRGFTLVEVSILLTVVVILSAAMTPVLSSMVSDTRDTVVRAEMVAISEALQQFLEDLGCSFVPQNNESASASARRGGVVSAPFVAPPTAPPSSDGGLAQRAATVRASLPCSVTNVCSGDPVELLVSTGDTPALGPGAEDDWVSPVDREWVDFLEYYLISNTPGNDRTRAFPDLDDCGVPLAGTLAAVRAWRGAYLNVGGGDPWGNRYMINTALLVGNSGGDVVVLSAGPDQEVDSAFNMDGFVPGDDDIALLFSAGQ